MHNTITNDGTDAPGRPQPIIFQVVGYKNTGKTTMVCRLTEKLKLAAWSVATIKHDAHDFQMDTPGTDSWRHQQAGADVTAIVSASRTAILKQSPDSLDELIAAMKDVDIIILEGFKQAIFPKLILLRSENDLPLAEALSNPLAFILWPQASSLAAMHEALTSERLRGVPRYDIDDTESILQVILRL